MCIVLGRGGLDVWVALLKGIGRLETWFLIECQCSPVSTRHILLHGSCRTNGRTLAKLHHLSQAHSSRRKTGVVLDGVHQWLRPLPRHDAVGKAARPVTI